VESDESRGTSFYFHIKAKQTEPLLKEYIHNPSASLKNKRVLIVDDNQTNRMLLCAQTKSWRMLPTAVNSASEAIAYLDKDSGYDIALLDMQMPEEDGITLAAKIKRKSHLKNMPLLLLTSMGKRSEDKPLRYHY